MDWSKVTDGIIKTVNGTFGTTVSYTAKGQSAVSIKAVFDAAFVSVQSGGEVTVASTQPVLFVRIADLPQKPSNSDTATINSVNYKVKEVQEDGWGGALLALQKTS